jgi:hypothetical protein
MCNDVMRTAQENEDTIGIHSEKNGPRSCRVVASKTEFASGFFEEKPRRETDPRILNNLN